jgi:phosphatidylglycerol lysyltransferase
MSPPLPAEPAVPVLRHIQRWVMPLLILAVLALSWTAVSRLLSEVSYEDLMTAIDAVPHSTLLVGLLLTAVSFAALTTYDVMALRFIGRPLPYATVAVTSFCAYAVGNTAGFGPLTAGAIRYRFYGPCGLTPEELAKVVGFVTATFGLGLIATTGLGLVIARPIPGLPLPAALQTLIGLLLLVAVGLLMLAGRRGGFSLRGWRLPLPSPLMISGQIAAAAVDLAASGAVLWVLLPADAVPLPAFILIFTVAIGLGTLSHVPAGLGIFETIIIAALAGQVEPERTLGALLLYRALYHLVPLLAAALLVALAEARRLAAITAVASAVHATGRLAPPVLGALTMVMGGLLIFSSVTPNTGYATDYLAQHMPLLLLEGAHFISSVLGIGLLITARGVLYRLDGAWWMAVILCSIAALLAVLKGLAIGEMILLTVLLVSLLNSRNQFTRKASLLHQSFTMPWIMAMGTLLVTAAALLVFVLKNVDYAHHLWWEFEITEDAPRSLRGLVALLLATGAAALWYLLRPQRVKLTAPTPDDMRQARAIVASQPMPYSNLVELGDKSLMFSEDGRAFIMYSRQGRSWVALFDPVGPEETWPDLIWRFIETARAAGGRAAFYETRPDTLSLYIDAGMRVVKLGEAARVDMAGFDLAGSKRANLRNAVNRLEKEGYSFRILSPQEVPARLDELETVSRDWLKRHNAREKRFSLGSFSRQTVSRQPVAIFEKDGSIVAFATLLLTDAGVEGAVDLMRFSEAAPPRTMDYLFAKMLLHYKAAGYHWFDLGMTPLAGLSPGNGGPLWYRVGRMIFDYGDRFYNFSGLRSFKSKFDPVWEPRYLAFTSDANPLLVLADTAVLISGGLRGVVGK